MHYPFNLRLILLLLVNLSIHQSLAGCHVDDENGLLAFKSGIKSDKSGMLNSWKDGTDCCRWNGISCSPKSNNRVTTITLFGLFSESSKSILPGPISPSLSKLQYLESLTLMNLEITGGIPSSFQRLKKLRSLDLGWNKLTGSIPDIFAGLTFLQYVHLSRNQLSGNIPRSLFRLQRPITIDMSYNALTGYIPSLSNRFNSIRTLHLSWNQLSGVVPTSFANFVGIQSLDVSYNKLNGSFPEMIKMVNSDMYKVDLSYNDFHLRVIPKWIGNTSIGNLNLAKCGIKMKLNDWKPSAIYTSVDLSENELTGTPLELLKSKNTSLAIFRASGNKLKFNMTHIKIGELEYFDLSNNLVFGNVPKTISRLRELNVSHNHLCGPLPATTFSASAFLDNDCLCGAPLPPCKL